MNETKVLWTIREIYGLPIINQIDIENLVTYLLRLNEKQE